MQKRLFTLFLAAFIFGLSGYSQNLKPGFDKAEYGELMKISARSTAEASYHNQFPPPERFNMQYQSKVIGLDNKWDLWTDNRGTAAISIRGTTANPESWLSNFYAAMVSAKGQLQLSGQETFPYELATHPKAAVHVGWLLGMAFLATDILPRIDSCYKKGIKDILIIGHSQGGAIAFLFTAHLYHLQKQNRLPADIRFKTYCSAGPKPGNLYFAYEYEAQTQAGWAFNVVNSADWVPETPVSIQTTDDFNTTNPFLNAKSAIKKQKFPQNLILSKVYKRLDKPTRKAQRAYQKYLGNLTSRLIRKNLSSFQPPAYYPSNDYVRTGTTIVLLAEEAYYERFPDNKDTPFVHHFHEAYLYLIEQYGR
jgi:pimeloyl-ACP methyl ester carboxylesterase